MVQAQHDLSGWKTPEEEELERKHTELAALEAQLIQQELDLTTLQASLTTFRDRYLRLVGVRYARLDQAEADVAAVVASLNTLNEAARQRRDEAQARAEASAEATRGYQPNRSHPRIQPVFFEAFDPSAHLRQVYRDVAKRLHPDLATDEAERARRTRFMTEANRAYQDRDEARLAAILREWEASPEAIAGEDLGAQLIRVIRKVAQIRKRLRQIETEVAEIEGTDLSRLKLKADQASREGRDLLQEMAALLDVQIARAHERLANARGGRR